MPHFVLFGNFVFCHIGLLLVYFDLFVCFVEFCFCVFNFAFVFKKEKKNIKLGRSGGRVELVQEEKQSKLHCMKKFNKHFSINIIINISKKVKRHSHMED